MQRGTAVALQRGARVPRVRGRVKLTAHVLPAQTLRMGPPDTWQGWVFLVLWVASFAAVASQPPGIMHGVMALALIGFLLFVASR